MSNFSQCIILQHGIKNKKEIIFSNKLSYLPGRNSRKQRLEYQDTSYKYIQILKKKKEIKVQALTMKVVILAT